MLNPLLIRYLPLYCQTQGFSLKISYWPTKLNIGDFKTPKPQVKQVPNLRSDTTQTTCINSKNALFDTCNWHKHLVESLIPCLQWRLALWWNVWCSYDNWYAEFLILANRTRSCVVLQQISEHLDWLNFGVVMFQLANVLQANKISIGPYSQSPFCLRALSQSAQQSSKPMQNWAH